MSENEIKQEPKKKVDVERLVVTAVLLALGTVLSLFTPFRLPQGGGITILSMLPVVLIAYRYGMLWGLGSSFVFSLLQMMTGFGTVSSFFLPGENQETLARALLILLLDYVIAFTVLCLGGLFRKSSNQAAGLCLGAIVAVTARYVVHIISGALLFGKWAEWWFTDVMGGDFGASVMEQYSGFGLGLFYSVIYNGLYMIPEIILTAIGAFIVGKIPQVVGKRGEL